MSLQQHFIFQRSAWAAEHKLQGSRSQLWPRPVPSPPLCSVTPSRPATHASPQRAGSGSLPQNPRPRNTCTLAEAGLPAPQLLTLATLAKARPPQAARNSHLGESISHPLHTAPCNSSKPKPGHRSRRDQCSYSWLGNQIGSFSAKRKFYLISPHKGEGKTKAPEFCQSWGLFSLLHPIDGIVLAFLLLPGVGGMNLERGYPNENMKN